MGTTENKLARELFVEKGNIKDLKPFQLYLEK